MDRGFHTVTHEDGSQIHVVVDMARSVYHQRTKKTTRILG